MIPVNEPLLGEKELTYVSECIRSGWISSSGKFIEEFESKWAEYCGRKFGVALSNGTVALQAAIAALNLNPGDQIIIPTFTIISCALAVIYNKCIPVLVDSDPQFWCMDTKQIEDKITLRTKAIMPVHIYGHPVDMGPILEIAEKYGLAIIEDAAEAHGAEYLKDWDNLNSSWKRCGSFGTMSCFSFYANKLITTGEGGMVLMDDEVLANRLRALRNLCFLPERRFYHKEMGSNYRITNMQAALGLAQIERIDQIVECKRWIGQEYTRRLKDISGLQLPIEKPWARNVYWMYGVVLAENTGLNAQDFALKLAKQGVETRPFFLGMHEQPVFRQKGMFAGEHYPVAERLARQGLYLPSGLALTKDQIGQVCDSIHTVLI